MAYLSHYREILWQAGSQVKTGPQCERAKVELLSPVFSLPLLFTYKFLHLSEWALGKSVALDGAGLSSDPVQGFGAYSQSASSS